jgi:hypothetical protein
LILALQLRRGVAVVGFRLLYWKISRWRIQFNPTFSYAAK